MKRNLTFIKLKSPLILFIFRRKNEIKNKTLKNDFLFLEKRVFESPSLSSKVRLPIRKVP